MYTYGSTTYPLEFNYEIQGMSSNARKSYWDWDYSQVYPNGPNESNKDLKELMNAIERFNKTNDNIKGDKQIMKVYNIVVIDKKECGIIKQATVVANDKETAMLELNLEKEILKKVRSGEVGFLFNSLGEFEKIEEK